MKILTVIGARPQFIKAAVISREIAEYNIEHSDHPVKEIIVHTGQHYDTNMSDVFFEEMHIPKPDYSLDISGNNLHGSMTGRMLEKIEEVILKEKPDVVLVYGDTNSTLAGALAAVKLHVPVAHVEAGLRSFNMHMPEEVNRVLTDRVSKWLFCPTETAVKNLIVEGFIATQQLVGEFSRKRVEFVGDIMYDAALFYGKIAQPSSYISNLIQEAGEEFYLATVHRAENTDYPDRLRNIFQALDSIANKTPVVLPLHPRTRKKLKEFNINIRDIKIINPVGYFDMITLIKNCQGVFTDSGGLQKEAFFFGKPCVTLRDETEWMELINNGFNVLVGADYTKILLAEEGIKEKVIDHTISLYGSGDAGKKIVKILLGENK